MRYYCSIVLFSFLVSGYSYNTSAAQPLVDLAIDDLYNYRLESSINLLDSALIIDPNHPVVPFLTIAVNFIQAQAVDGVEFSYSNINSDIIQTIPIYKQLINKYQENPEYLLYLGSTYGLRSRIAYGRKDWFGVLYNSYQGLKYIRKAHSMDPDLMDTYTPIGLIEYASCLTPDPIKWLASWAGLHGDCDIGLENLDKANRNSYYSWIEGSFITSYIYMHIERDYINAEILIDRLLNRFPGHPFFPFIKGELLARQNKWIELESFMETMQNFINSGPDIQRHECTIKYMYIESMKAFYDTDYKKVIKNTSYIVDNYNMEFDWLNGFAHLLRGKSYDIIGHRASAIDDYKRVLDLDSFYPEHNEAVSYLKTPFLLNK